MIDLPYHPHVEKCNEVYHTVEKGVYYFSSENKILYEILTPNIKRPEHKLWKFSHLHKHPLKIGGYSYHSIRDDMCITCRMTFPSFESLIMTIRLQEFKNDGRGLPLT
jgi:hypothetical protein